MKFGIIAAIMAILAIGMVSAVGQTSGVNDFRCWKTTMLVSKDPTTWNVVKGASGLLGYNKCSDKFIFDGVKLAPKTAYSLVYYPDPWPAVGCMVLGTGTSTNKGLIGFGGSFDFDKIPITTTTTSVPTNVGQCNPAGNYGGWDKTSPCYTVLKPTCDITQTASFTVGFSDKITTKITIPHLDGITDDSFAVMDGSNTLCSYTDTGSTETWMDLTCPVSLVGVKTLTIKSLAASPWSLCDTYGQLAIKDITFDTTSKGSKIWLVPSSDVSCPTGFSAWNPKGYLFETQMI